MDLEETKRPLEWVEVPADAARTMEPGTMYALVSERLTEEEKAALSEYLAWFRARSADELPAESYVNPRSPFGI